MSRLLIIDDDPEVCSLLDSFLTEEGFETRTAATAAAGLSALEAGRPDMVLLDVVLPDNNGFDVLRTIREASGVPVVMLTGRDQEVDRVLGLELGADDYVSKPLRLRELVARIRAVLRRQQVRNGDAPTLQERLRVGSLDLWPRARSARVLGRDVHLTAAEFGILEQLAMEPGRLVDRETLLDRALGNPNAADDCVLNVHICNLRRKLGDEVSIKTIRGRGYILAAGGMPG